MSRQVGRMRKRRSLAGDRPIEAAKAGQRLVLLPPPEAGPLEVLAAYGNRATWDLIERERPDTRVMHIEPDDPRPGSAGRAAMKALRGLDLARFDAIDLDSDALPAQQVVEVARQMYQGIVFWTCRRPLRGKAAAPNPLLEACGIPPDWRAIAPALVCAGDLWTDWAQLLAAPAPGVAGWEWAVVAERGDVLYGAVGHDHPADTEACWRRAKTLLARPVLLDRPDPLPNRLILTNLPQPGQTPERVAL